MGSWVINKFSTYQQKEKRSIKEKVNNNNSKFKVNLKSQPISGIHKIPRLKFQDTNPKTCTNPLEFGFLNFEFGSSKLHQAIQMNV